jgi:hypothetical protein
LLALLAHDFLHVSKIKVNKKIQLDATIRRHLFTAKSLYMFRESLRPSSGVLKTVTATSGIGHNIGAAALFQRGLIRPRWKEAAAPINVCVLLHQVGSSF